MDNQEIAMHLTVSAIYWLQESEEMEFERDADKVGNNVAKLYKTILKSIDPPIKSITPAVA